MTNDGRVRHYADLFPIVANAIAAAPLAEWLERFRQAGVPAGAVRGVDVALADPQTAAREMVAEVDHATIGNLPVLGLPIKLSDTPGAVRSAPPVLGQHTRAVLTGDLGLSDAELDGLAARGVVKYR